MEKKRVSLSDTIALPVPLICSATFCKTKENGSNFQLWKWLAEINIWKEIQLLNVFELKMVICRQEKVLF